MPQPFRCGEVRHWGEGRLDLLSVRGSRLHLTNDLIAHNLIFNYYPLVQQALPLPCTSDLLGWPLTAPWGDDQPFASARSSTLLTCMADHLPSRGVLMPPAFKPAAIYGSGLARVVHPDAVG